VPHYPRVGALLCMSFFFFIPRKTRPRSVATTYKKQPKSRQLTRRLYPGFSLMLQGFARLATSDTGYIRSPRSLIFCFFTLTSPRFSADRTFDFLDINRLAQSSMTRFFLAFPSLAGPPILPFPPPYASLIGSCPLFPLFLTKRKGVCLFPLSP